MRARACNECINIFICTYTSAVSVRALAGRGRMKNDDGMWDNFGDSFGR